METLEAFLKLLGFGPDNIQAVLYISLASVFGTQVLKHSAPQVRGEIVSALLGGLFGATLMPDHMRGAAVGIVLGCFWAFAYKPLMRMAYKRWPELEEKVSAAPRLKRMDNGDIGIKDGENKTRVLTQEERELFIGAPTEKPGDPTVPKDKPSDK